MPSRRTPNSKPSVLRVFRTAADAYLNTPNPADRAIGPALFAQIDPSDPDSLRSRLEREVSDTEKALAAQGPLTTATAQAAARLTIFVSHFHQVLDFAIVRGVLAPGDRAFYGRDLSATTLPDLSTYDAVEEAAAKIDQGEAARNIAAGPAFVPMAMPSAADVKTALVAYKAAHKESENALTKTDSEREAASAVYIEAQALAVDIYDTVEFFYRKDPSDSSRREKCRRWGVVYINDAPPADEQPVNPAPPTPPPAPGA